MTRPAPPANTRQPARTDAAPIDWYNVVVETNVMIRLQDVKRRADSLGDRIDAAKRKCVTGYRCGAGCISMNKRCLKTPGSPASKQKMKRVLALAAAAWVIASMPRSASA